MYTNKCIKCGKEFETKNPKRVICPDCLYPDKATTATATDNAPAQTGTEYPSSYSFGNDNAPQPRYNKRPSYNNNNGGGGYRQDNRRSFGGGQRPQGAFNRSNGQRPQGGGFNRSNGQRPQGGGFNRGGGFKKPQRPQKPKVLLVNREQLAQIEEMYKKMLPLPNPDAHEVIATAINLEPKKVFFGINLIRQKLMLPKVQMPKRKLALTPDQLMAIKNLYEPLLPLPPIGCHKILAAQLKMDEWRVHVGIGLVRKQMGLDRWNQEREDAPEEYRKS